MAGMKKLYSSKPALQSFTSLSSSEMIHLSVSARSADSTIGKLDRNLDTFQSLVRNFFVDSIFCSEQRKSFPWLTSLALQNLKVSAPNFSIIGRGSSAFPLLFRHLHSLLIQAISHNPSLGPRLLACKIFNIGEEYSTAMS